MERQRWEGGPGDGVSSGVFAVITVIPALLRRLLVPRDTHGAF